MKGFFEKKLHNSIPPHWAEGVRIVIGGAYGGLALQAGTGFVFPWTILKGVLVVATGALFIRFLNYTDSGRSNEMADSDEPSEQDFIEVGSVQLRDH